MKTTKSHPIVQALLALFIIMGLVSLCGAAAYMKIGDIKGEAVDKDHKDWIIIESLSAPIFRALPDSAGGCQFVPDGGGGNTLGDVVVVKQLDSSSTQFQQAACSGQFLDEVVIHLVSTTGHSSKPAFVEYKLLNVFVTDYVITPGFSEDGELVPMEEVKLNYTDIEFEYVETADPKNKGKGKGKGGA